MIIGIIGGSFDPPHNSHKVIIDKCIKDKLVDEVWVCPSYNHVEKTNYASFEHRVRMCKMMFTGWFKPVYICELEKESTTNTTFELIRRLKMKYIHHTFKIIIGEDCADNIESWYLWEDLIRKVPFIVFKREDYVSSHPKQWYNENSHKVIKCEDCWLSSSYVRKLMMTKCYNLVKIFCTKPKIVRFVLKNYLYQRSSR